MRFVAVVLLLASMGLAHAETMMTSSYRAKAPHIAAHRTLPLGTKLKVTNPKNGKSVVVTIGTRGPFTRGRHLDISDAYARQLGFGKSGVLRLKTEKVRE